MGEAMMIIGEVTKIIIVVATVVVMVVMKIIIGEEVMVVMTVVIVVMTVVVMTVVVVVMVMIVVTAVATCLLGEAIVDNSALMYLRITAKLRLCLIGYYWLFNERIDERFMHGLARYYWIDDFFIIK